jgi:hypothetical protein
MLRIGSVTQVQDDALSVSFSEIEQIDSVPLLAFNGLQLSPKVGDFVLIFSPEGNLSNSVALGVMSLATKSTAHDVLLTSENQTLGQALQSLKNAIEEIRGPGFFTSASGPVSVQQPAPKPIDLKGFS